jgi:DNA-binding NarL/FixJ family response regulator
MRVGVCSPNRLLRESIANTLAAEEGISAFTVVSVRELHRPDGTAPPAVVVIDVASLNRDDYHYLVGATVFGYVKPILLGDPREEYPALGAALAFDAPVEELVTMVRGSVQPEPKRERIPRNCDNSFRLTAREFEIARLVARGLSNRAIAETLAIKEQSVRNLVSSVLTKLGCDNRVQVAITLADTTIG